MTTFLVTGCKTSSPCVALRISNEDTFLHVSSKAPKRSLVPLDEHIGSKAPNMKHRQIWLGSIKASCGVLSGSAEVNSLLLV